MKSIDSPKSFPTKPLDQTLASWAAQTSNRGFEKKLSLLEIQQQEAERLKQEEDERVRKSVEDNPASAALVVENEPKLAWSSPSVAKVPKQQSMFEIQKEEEARARLQELEARNARTVTSGVATSAAWRALPVSTTYSLKSPRN